MSTDALARQEVVDAWRMVAARRSLEGRLPLASMQRLRDSLLQPEGEVRYQLEFDRDAFKVAYVEARIQTDLPLQCQRSLTRYLHPVDVVVRLGLIREEAEESGLPEGYEPLLLPQDGALRPAELVEDELILALPVFPAAPGTEAMARDWPAEEAEVEAVNPFAGLASLKRSD